MGVFQLMLIISLSAASRAHNCSYSWSEIEGDCWGIFAFKEGEPETWNNAKLLCQRKGAVLGYPRTNAAIEDIMREATLSPEFDRGWRWLHVGLHSTTGINGTYVVLETGKEPDEEIPWTPGHPKNFPYHNRGPCAQLNIGFVNNEHRPGLLVNFACDFDAIARIGYACKDLELGTTTAAPPRPTTSTQGATRSQESSTTGSVPRITDTTAETPYLLILAVVGGLIAAIVTTGMCCGSALLLHFFPDKDQADVASLGSKGERETDDKTSGSDDSNTSGSDD